MVLLLAACNVRSVLSPTAREKYERQFRGNDSLLNAWNLAYATALQQPRSLPLPLSLTARMPDVEQSALGFELALRRGQALVVEMDRGCDTCIFFVELHRKADVDNNKSRLLEFLSDDESRLYRVFEDTDTVRLLVQSAIAQSVPFSIRIYAQPAYLFPVAGRSNKAIASFWGADRDAGRRRHEGVDIFAPRGTPVVAVQDGRVGFTGERGLGGRQVWLREREMGYNVYYAHLDSIAARTGQSVKRGDTLGFVGNTGNAITTSPHLHFGVYGSGGAVDPIEFIREVEVPEFADSISHSQVVTRRTRNELRAVPEAGHPALLSLARNDTLDVLGNTNQWYLVEVGGVSGFIRKEEVRGVGR